MPPSLPAPRTASLLSESLRVMVETLFLTPRRRSMFRPNGERWWVTGDGWQAARGRLQVAGGGFARAGRPSCGGQAEKLLVRHTNATLPPTRVFLRKSAE